MLAADYLPFDITNEEGDRIALLAVPEAQPPQSGDKVTRNETKAIRLVFENAVTYDETVNLVHQYYSYFSADVPYHYLVAD